MEDNAQTHRSPLNIVAVSNDALRPEFLDMLLAEDSGEDVIVMESIARAYSRVRQLQPALVVLYIDIEDEDACRLLSMLQNDPALRGLRILLCASDRDRTARHRLRAVEGQSENLAEYFGSAF
jgi:CheY-like chemotaxis protein